MKKLTRSEVLTIPNILSLVRLALIPVYAILYLQAETTKEYILSASVFACSALTDMIDGIIARRFHMISRLGIFLDPVADKCTQGVIIICLTIRHFVIWPLLVLFIIKESFMLIMGLVQFRKNRMLDGALFAGKICTTVLFIGMILLVLFPKLPNNGLILIETVCGFFMLVSLVSYAKCYFGNSQHIRELE